MNTIIKGWRETRHGNIPINRTFNMDTMLFADDQVLITKSESVLQYSVHNLNKTAAKYFLEINIEKTKVMAFKGREPVRSKICINNKTLEQVNTFYYLGYYLSYEEEKDMNMKITNFLKITGIINQIFKPNLVSKYTRSKIYKILARPTLTYDSESWTIRINDRKRLISAEMRFIRTLGYTLFDHKRNELMDKQLKITPIIDFVTQNWKNWKEHVHRMTPERIPKIILKYKPKRKICLGRLLKRLKDSVM
jgi:hypothetical protein